MFRLKELREESGIKRSELARALQMNAGTIANYENEIRQAPYELLILSAEYFDVSVDYLLGREPYQPLANPVAGALNETERKLIFDYRALSPTAKSRVAEYTELWKEKS